jgi:hypothetical protein
MTAQYQNIDILAFVCVYKRHFKNSIIHNPNELIISKLAKQLGCTSKKIKKYIELLCAKNLVIKRGNSYQIVSLGKCINALINKEKQGYYVRFFTHLKSKEFILPITAKCKDYKNLIEQELVKLNFNLQLHKQYVASDNTKHCFEKRVALQGQSKANFGAKTGAYHLSSVIGCCPTTSQRRLKKWAENKLIVRKLTIASNNELIQQNLPDSLKKFKNRLSFSRFYCIGSEITDFKNLGCFVKPENRKSKDEFHFIRLTQITNNNINTLWATR